MGKDSIKLRKGKPSADEGLLCGEYLDQAAEGFFSFMLGHDASRIISEAYVSPNHSYSYENVIFAERDNEIVGMALGFSGKQHLGFSEGSLKQASGYPKVRTAIVNTLFAPLIRILKSIPPNDFYLLAVAIEPTHQGEGIGSLLMDAVEERARLMGCKRLSLDVSASNRGAQKLYERRGMAIESQWPKRIPLPLLKFYRMSKAVPEPD